MIKMRGSHKPTAAPEYGLLADRSTDSVEAAFKTSQKFILEKEKLLRPYGLDKMKEPAIVLMDYYEEGIQRARNEGKQHRYREKHVGGIEILDLCSPGWRMENVEKALEGITKETEKAAEVLKHLINDVKMIADPLEFELVDMLKRIRSTKMAIVTETEAALSKMKDVRNFFLDNNYKVEMERLERFVTICKEIKKLKDEGIFDAIVDSSIRLAVKEERNAGKQSDEKGRGV